jgi:hypothetical protein
MALVERLSEADGYPAKWLKSSSRETVWKVRLGDKMVPYQVNETALKGLLWALHAIEDPLSRVLLRLSRQSLYAFG